MKTINQTRFTTFKKKKKGLRRNTLSGSVLWLWNQICMIYDAHIDSQMKVNFAGQYYSSCVYFESDLFYSMSI